MNFYITQPGPTKGSALLKGTGFSWHVNGLVKPQSLEVAWMDSHIARTIFCDVSAHSPLKALELVKAPFLLWSYSKKGIEVKPSI